MRYLRLKVIESDTPQQERKWRCSNCHLLFFHEKSRPKVTSFLTECSTVMLCNDCAADLVTEEPSELVKAVKELLDNNSVRFCSDEGPLEEGWQSDKLMALWKKIEELVEK